VLCIYSIFMDVHRTDSSLFIQGFLRFTLCATKRKRLLVLLKLHLVIKSTGRSASHSRLASNARDRKELSAAQLSKLPLESQIEELSTRYGSPSSALSYSP